MALRPDFCISDTHWFHKNIVQYQNRDMNHDWIMLKRWRATVQDHHTVLHVGDLFFGRRNGLERFTCEIAPKLTGQKYLILGNHDRRDIDYEKLGFTVLDPYSIDYDGFTVTFDHYPRLIHDAMKRIHIHGHIHGNGYANGDKHRRNNVNVSVEVIDYRPQKFSHLVNTAILARKKGDPYYNSKAYRYASRDRARRAA